MLLRQLDTLGHSLTTARVGIPAGASEKVISDVRGCFSPGAPVFSAIYYWLASDDLAQIGQKKGLFSLILTHTHRVAGWPGRYINVLRCGRLFMVLLQLKEHLKLFVKRTEFLSRRDITKDVDSDLKANSFLLSFDQ